MPRTARSLHRIVAIAVLLPWVILSRAQQERPTMVRCDTVAVDGVLTPGRIMDLSRIEDGTSGLLLADGHLWTHGDQESNTLYRLDVAGRSWDRKIKLADKPRDWEELATWGGRVYVADIGHNTFKDTIERRYFHFDLSALGTGKSLQAIPVRFNYPAQDYHLDSLEGSPRYQYWDCEALVIVDDTVYLFSKNWPKDTANPCGTKRESIVYTLPLGENKKAKEEARWSAPGLVAGATFHPEYGLILAGSEFDSFAPFMMVLPDFPKNKSGSSARTYRLDMDCAQVEAVAVGDDGWVYFTNEREYIMPCCCPETVTSAAALWRVRLPR